MKILICGAGQVGWQLARHLSTENNDVTVIDNNGALVRRITDALDVNGITGFASYPDVLEKAGASDADMIIAATYSDEVNMVTCQVAHSVFEVPQKIARIREQAYLNSEYSDLYRREHLPIDVIISPEKEVAEAAIRRLASPAAFDTESFIDGKVQLIGITLEEDCAVVNTPLRQLSELFSTLRAVVVAVRRDERFFVPQSNDQLFTNDAVYLVVAKDDVARTYEIFGKSNPTSKRAIIIGGGNVGLSVAQHLEKSEQRIRCKMIEYNREQAEIAADTLDRTIVLCGDGLDMELLEEANIAKTDVVLAVTDDDKTNLLSCARAKAIGAPLTIALVNDPSLTSLMNPLGIDAFINPRATTVSSILRHLRHGSVRKVYSIGDAEGEVIEAQVLNTSTINGKNIRDIDWPEGAIIGAIEKNGEIIIPKGNTKIEEGDIMTVFALRADIPVIEQLFQVSIDFF